MMCQRCVMDTSDPDISFDELGFCNHCRASSELLKQVESLRSSERVDDIVDRIQADGRQSPYDCIIGLSGGVDSSYLAYKAKHLGLRPLAIHLDNGWDSELAIKNIENVVRKLDLDLHTHVVNWPEFRDIQLSFFKANVIDIEMVTDQAIFALAYQQAVSRGIKYILTGVNVVTESIMPSAWVHPKFDLRNLKAIHKEHGSVPLRTLPVASTLRVRYLESVKKITRVDLLNLLPYDKNEAMELLVDRLGWQDYGGKHHESIFTRFYQQVILPTKFGVDKRRAHLSSLICAGQSSREAAMAALLEPPCDPGLASSDKTYVSKKLGMSEEEMDTYLDSPPKSHYDYPSDQSYLRAASRVKGAFRKSSPT